MNPSLSAGAAPMKTLIVGAGPAGLYLAYLLRRQDPAAAIRIVEQNAADSTFGFGVVFSDRALEFLREDDPETHALITPALETWSDMTLHHRGERITIDGIGFAAIGRLRLLQLMQQRLASVGVVPEYGRALRDAAELDGHDLVVAADGANSFVRSTLESEFGTKIEPLRNHFVWYGTTQRFDTLSQTFVETPLGRFNAHHYRYAGDAAAFSGAGRNGAAAGTQHDAEPVSTFIVECDPETWQRAGFATLDAEQTRRACEQIFAATLAGHRLVENKSVWRHFPLVSNERWSVGNRVLVGDALRTAHFSIGSGTRLAFEDVIALARALREHAGDIPAALAAYEAARRPVVEKLAAAAECSARWYERFGEHMRLDPWSFAWSYIQRSGRIDPARLEALSPRFVAGYRRHVAEAGASAGETR